MDFEPYWRNKKIGVDWKTENGITFVLICITQK